MPILYAKLGNPQSLNLSLAFAVICDLREEVRVEIDDVPLIAGQMTDNLQVGLFGVKLTDDAPTLGLSGPRHKNGTPTNKMVRRLIHPRRRGILVAAFGGGSSICR